MTEIAFGIARGLQYAAIALWRSAGSPSCSSPGCPALARGRRRARQLVAGRAGLLRAAAAGAARSPRPSARSAPPPGSSSRGPRRPGSPASPRSRDDRPRDAGNEVRHDLGPRRARLGRLRRCSPAAGRLRRRGRAAAARPARAARRCSPLPAGLPRPRARRSPATAARQSPVALLLPGQRRPRRRDGGLARRPGDAALRRCRAATRASCEPADRGRLLAAALVALLAGRADRGRRDPRSPA